jgi:hypothetical protein
MGWASRMGSSLSFYIFTVVTRPRPNYCYQLQLQQFKILHQPYIRLGTVIITKNKLPIAY